ncbi:MAG: hypothetical protein PHY43_09135 [Verrucomicrobiales bacterium]|nr:hypothetical protein [Verrucomicrobiales bacterium]
MRTPIAFFCALLVAGSAFAQAYSIAKQQAKNAANNESEQHGGVHPSPPPPPGQHLDKPEAD